MRARGKEREMHLLKAPISLFIKEETQNEIRFNFESSTSKKEDLRHYLFMEPQDAEIWA